MFNHSVGRGTIEIRRSAKNSIYLAESLAMLTLLSVIAAMFILAITG